MKILFFLLFFSFKLYADDIFYNDEIDEISNIIDSVKKSIDSSNIDTKETSLSKDEEILNLQKPLKGDVFLSTSFKDYTGEAGSWLLNILYESHDYESGARKHGVSIEYAWVFDLKYIAFHAISNLSYYQGYNDKKGFIPIGIGAEFVLGLPDLMFLSTHYVFEYAKQEAGDFINFSRYGIGMYFNLTGLNKSSQFQMYKNHGIRRTYFIVKYNIRNTTSIIDYYSKTSINIGLGFEY